jgi:hypothetical protein
MSAAQAAPGPLDTPQAATQQLQPGEELELSPDPENPEDSEALAVRARGLHVGFAPRYLLRDLHTLRQANPAHSSLTVTRVNLPPTPLQFRLLAAFEAPWPQDFRAFAGPEFEPLRSDLAAVA